MIKGSDNFVEYDWLPSVRAIPALYETSGAYEPWFRIKKSKKYDHQYIKRILIVYEILYWHRL
jgi:hypothetical protein